MPTKKGTPTKLEKQLAAVRKAETDAAIAATEENLRNGPLRDKQGLGLDELNACEALGQAYLGLKEQGKL